MIPVALIILCTKLNDSTPENRKEFNAYLDPQYNEIKPIKVGLFAAKMDYSKIKGFSRFAVKRKAKLTEGDFNKRRTIKNWAEELFSLL